MPILHVSYDGVVSKSEYIALFPLSVAADNLTVGLILRLDKNHNYFLIYIHIC